MIEALAAVYPRRLEQSSHMARAGLDAVALALVDADGLPELVERRRASRLPIGSQRWRLTQARRLLNARWRSEKLGPTSGSATTLATSQCCGPGRLRAARPLHERALTIREKVLGPEHPDTAESLDNLARLLQDHGDLAAARPLHERALTIREKVLGPRASRYSDPASTTSPTCCRPRASLRRRGRSASARWQSAKKCSVAEHAEYGGEP